MSLTAYCRADERQRIGPEVDPAPLLGTWVNLNRETVHMQSLTLTRSGAGFVLGARMAETGDLEPVPARVYVADGTNEPLGFTARLLTEDAEINLSANQTQGICVVQTYTNYREPAGRSDFFTKEFFRQEGGAR